jgi:hypothetical protein
VTVDFRLADDTGTYKPVQGLWIAGPDGTFKPVRNAWVADDTERYQQFWPTNTEVEAFTAVKGMLGLRTYSSVTLAWTVWNAAKIELRLVGVTKPVYTVNQPVPTGNPVTDELNLMGWLGTTLSGLVPGKTYRYQLTAYGAGGSTVLSDIVSVTLDKLPAPAAFVRSGGTAFGSYYTWNPVDGADGYEIVDVANLALPVKDTVTVPTGLETGQLANTVYSRAVRAKLGTVKSALSAKITYTTPKAPGTAPGGYPFQATGFDVWAPGWSGWRGDGNGIIHGNGDNFGGNNGDNATFFFYDVAAIRALSGRVTGFGVRLKRDTSAGYSSPQLSRWWLHTYTSRPGGAPVYTANATIDSGWSAWGDDELLALPIGWGQAFIDGAFDVCGLVWGGVPGRYMRGPGPVSFPWQGGIYFILG